MAASFPFHALRNATGVGGGIEFAVGPAMTRVISKEPTIPAVGSNNWPQGDEITRKIYESYQQFRTLITNWSDIS